MIHKFPHLAILSFSLCLHTTVNYSSAAESQRLPELVVTATPGGQWTEPDVSESLGLSLNPLSTPIQVSRVSQALNYRQGNLTLQEAMVNSAGVLTATGNGIHDFFVVRGIDSLNGGLVMIDGVPEPEAAFYPMHAIREVQVLKGPGSFAFGSGALGGSVNLVRKSPLFTPFSVLALSLGSHDTYRVTLDAGQPYQDSFAFRLNGLYQQAESHRDGIDSEIYGITPSMRLQFSEKASLLVHVDYQESDVTPDAGIPTLGDRLYTPSRSASFRLPDDYSEQTNTRASLDYTYQLKEGTVLRNRAYYTELDWNTRGTIFGGFALFGAGAEAAPETLSRLQGALDNNQRIIGNETELTIPFDAGTIAHQALVGLEIAQFTDEFTLAINPATDINLPSGYVFPSILPAIPVNEGDAASLIYSAYAYDKIQINDQWSALAGGRVDYLDFEDDSRNTSRTDTEFSPFAGIVFQPTTEIALYVNGGMGFTPPSTQIVGDRGEPETSEQVEAGIKWQPENASWFGQLAIYRLERDNIAIPESSGLFSRTGRQESQGLELELQGEVIPGLDVLVAYGFLQSELERFSEQLGPTVSDRSGNDAPFTPEHTLQVWTEYEINHNWGIGLGVRAIDDHYIAPDNALTLAAYATVDAALFYTQPRWAVALRLNNLTDETYYSRGTGSLSVIPEDGLSALATLEINL